MTILELNTIPLRPCSLQLLNFTLKSMVITIIGLPQYFDNLTVAIVAFNNHHFHT